MANSLTLEAASVGQQERALVERHRAGDATAFEEYYADYSQLVFNVCLRQCGDRDLACDLSQEVFLRVFKSLARFKGRSSLKTWTYRVCLNHCRSRLGRRRRLQDFLSLSREDGDLELVDERRGPWEETLARDRSELLARALPRLEPQFREAVLLRDIEDLSYREVAEVLSVPIGTVRSRIARGREQLRKVIAQESLLDRTRAEEVT